MPLSQNQIRTRFAPSPTGFVHIGSLRTALFAYLFARHNNGQNILRIEDTDQNRLVKGSIENLLSVMNAMGIEFDEGPYLKNDEVVQRGEYGPYVQSQRKDAGIYQKYADQLLDSGQAYYCFCSEQRLEELRTEQIALKKPPMYDRHCRNLSKEEAVFKKSELEAAGRKPVVRQAIPLEGQTIVEDLIYGDIKYDHKVIDDQVIVKSDGFPTYHLAVVVDDHLMDITHVIRGEEWIPSTPKHILIYRALGWKPTQFAHLPLILNNDKSKLSKRQGDVSVEDFLRKGYLKEALVNFVAFLGWNPKTEQEIFSMADLIAQFDLKKVNKSGAVFDLNKLEWMNGLYIRSKPLAELVDLLVPFWQKDGYLEIEGDKIFAPNLGRELPRAYLEVVASLERERLKKLSEIGVGTRYFFADPLYGAEILTWKKSTPGDAKAKLSELKELMESLAEDDFELSKIEVAVKTFIAEKGYDNGSVLWPLRVALTGMDKSPGPFEVASVLGKGLGKEAVLQRLENAISKLN